MLCHRNHHSGNIHETAWKARLEQATLDWLALDQWEAQKSRLRKLSQNGIDLAISLPRGVLLRDGDVLVWDEARQAATVARVTLKEVMVVELGALRDADPGGVRSYLVWSWAMPWATSTGLLSSKGIACSSRSRWTRK